MSEHIVNVEPVPVPGGHANITPRYHARCGCGWTGNDRVSAGVAAKHRKEARESAQADGLAHAREARRREAGRECIGLNPDDCNVPYCPVHGTGTPPA